MFSIYISWSWLVQINNYAFALLTAGFFTFDRFCNLSINLSCNSMPYSAYLWGGLIKNKGGVGLTVCSCHDTYAFQSESTLYSCLNVKELLARTKWLSVRLRTKWFWVRVQLQFKALFLYEHKLKGHFQICISILLKH